MHGCIDLYPIFQETTMKTPVYVKMDEYDQLLLSEGVCQHLGIISYHPDNLYGSGADRSWSPCLSLMRRMKKEK